MLNQQLVLGSVYRVKFKGVFERHGVCTTSGLTCLHKGNGVFKLEAITTFRTLVLSGVKLYDTFFAPLGITQEEYDQYYSDKPADKYSPEYAIKQVQEKDTQTEWAQDRTTGVLTPLRKTVTITTEKYVETGASVLAKYAKDSVNFSAYPIYKFVDVVDPDDTVYAPALTIDGFPEIEISEYQDLSLVFRLGYFDDPTKLDPLLLAIRERLAAYGIKPKLIKLYSTGSKFMNPDEYEKLRSIRLPAVIETVPEDALFSDYVDRKIIETNVVKSIVDTRAPGANQVDFETLKARTVVLDRNLYSVEVGPNDLFNGSSTYYELLTDGSYRVLSSADCPVGGRVLNISKEERKYLQADADAGRYAYTTGPDVYVPIAFNEPRSASLYMKETTETHRDEVSINTETEYRHPNAEELADPYLVLYRKISGRLTRVNEPVINDPLNLYFIGESITGDIGTGRVFTENFASSGILRYVGHNFEYGTATSNMKTVHTMTSADIINFAQGAEVSDIQMYIEGETASNTIRATKYAGRIFRTTKQIEVNGESQTVPIEIILGDEPDPNLAGLTGDILGQRGVAAKDIYFLDTNVMNGNYYIKYLEAEQERRRLDDRNKKLERVIEQLTNS